jgi:hypothetical protein
MERYCSIPALFGLRHWFEPRFGDICKKHDRRYIERKLVKWYVDMCFCVYMVRRGGIFCAPLAAGAFVMFWSPIGLWYWYTE